jgi:hypothetical protein
MFRRILLGACAALLALGVSGCAAIEIGASTHTHQYGDKETDQRVENLTKRIEALESRQAGTLAPPAQ